MAHKIARDRTVLKGGLYKSGCMNINNKIFVLPINFENEMNLYQMR